jgi:hypothetical protein
MPLTTAFTPAGQFVSATNNVPAGHDQPDRQQGNLQLQARGATHSISPVSRDAESENDALYGALWAAPK